MAQIMWALLFMALGALITHISWLHAWKMYKSGKTEGQGLAERERNAESRRVRI